MAFLIGSPFSPALPRPYRSTFMGVAPVMVMPLTRDAMGVPPAMVVSPALVVAVPPRVNTDALENANRPLGVGEGAAARAVDVGSGRPSNVSFSRAIWLA